MAKVMERLHDVGVIVVVRAKDRKRVLPGVEAVLEGGCTAIEITFTVPDAVAVIREVANAFGDKILLGAGTVMNPSDAVAAIEAGAQYIVSPHTNPEVIGMANRLEAAVMPGALTPTEVVRAYNAGANAVKIFPASAFGPSYIKALHGPLPHIPLIPTGGISHENAADYIQAGAMALGAGSNLFDQKLLAEENYAEMTKRARSFVEAIKKARG